ncbi:SDR family NAD(P)-dependent oxidoreductase [Rubrivirga sp.]|uniref:SDR family NAD(P)-dependent oxidoreductase n=1 Tax=Rubrivirga sp. TaxID=1885344 RepID=UPI003C748AA5
MSDLAEKVALVTGGSRGIGAATAKRLAADGATVALSYNSSPDAAQAVVDEVTSAGGTAQAYQADASGPDAGAALVRQVVRDHGGLDILVNNAGVYKTGPVHEFSDEDYDANLDINLRGSFVTIREAAKHLRDNGRIVNIGSVVGKVGMPGNAVYGATKAGVTVLAKAVAKELGGRGITVNTVHPGAIDTDMNPADPEKNPFAETLAGMNPLGRYGTADEIAAAVSFLVSDDASYITGAELTVDGGMTA